jgi:hypothetical protein
MIACCGRYLQWCGDVTHEATVRKQRHPKTCVVGPRVCCLNTWLSTSWRGRQYHPRAHVSVPPPKGYRTPGSSIPWVASTASSSSLDLPRSLTRPYLRWRAVSTGERAFAKVSNQVQAGGHVRGRLIKSEASLPRHYTSHPKRLRMPVQKSW